jgi:hypothetical protein
MTSKLRKILGVALMGSASVMLGSTANSVQAGVAVVVNAGSGAAPISDQQAANIFLGKSNTLPDGTKVVPVDQEEGEAPRDEFYQKVVKKDASQLNAYWSRLIFTGKGQPPKAVLDDDEVLELIATDKSVIGYISSDAVDDSVKVLLSVP